MILIHIIIWTTQKSRVGVHISLLPARAHDAEHAHHGYSEQVYKGGMRSDSTVSPER